MNMDIYIKFNIDVENNIHIIAVLRRDFLFLLKQKPHPSKGSYNIDCMNPIPSEDWLIFPL